MTQIDIIVTESQIKEFQTVLQMQDGSISDYKGHQLVEDETIVGNSDKSIFYAKELVADLSVKPKHTLDPFLIAKLDVQSIKYF